jgi:glutaredoxin
MTKITLYSTKTCKECKVIKQILTNNNIQYNEVDLATPAGLTELRMNGCNALLAPVLQVDNKFYLRHELIQNINLIKDTIFN